MNNLTKEMTRYVLMNTNQDSELDSFGKIVGANAAGAWAWLSPSEMIGNLARTFDSKQKAMEYVVSQQLITKLGCVFKCEKIAVVATFLHSSD